MIDTLFCPVCNLKLKNRKLDQYIFYIENSSNYIERTCSNGMNHVLQILVDKKTKDVHWLKMSLSDNFSKFIEIDYLNNKSKITFFHKKNKEFIDLPKVIEPDFSNLNSLKEKVNTYVKFL